MRWFNKHASIEAGKGSWFGHGGIRNPQEYT
jgi:hypothetical protein